MIYTKNHVRIFFIHTHKKPARMMTQNSIMLWFSSQKSFSFPFPALSDLGDLLIWHHKGERSGMTLWTLKSHSSKMPDKDDICLRGNFFLFKVEENSVNILSHISKIDVTLSHFTVFETCDNAIFHHWIGSILIKKKIHLVFGQTVCSLMGTGLVPVPGMNMSNILYIQFTDSKTVSWGQGS